MHWKFPFLNTHTDAGAPAHTLKNKTSVILWRLRPTIIPILYVVNISQIQNANILKKTWTLKAGNQPAATNKSLINGYFMLITNNIVRTIPSVKPESFKTRKTLIEFTLGMHSLAISSIYMYAYTHNSPYKCVQYNGGTPWKCSMFVA